MSGVYAESIAAGKAFKEHLNQDPCSLSSFSKCLIPDLVICFNPLFSESCP